MLKVFDNVYQDDALGKLIEVVYDQSLVFGATSTDVNLPIFKASACDDLDPYAEQLLAYINAATGEDFSIVSYHLNAQPVGFDGAWHTDNQEDGCTHAASFYCHNVDWETSMGGYLLIGDSDAIAGSILPKKNRLVLHDADTPHCALAPNQRAGTIIRYSLTLKLKKS